MVTVVTREENGIPLTHDQVDDNFTGLADAINNIGADVIAPAVEAKDAAVAAANAAQTSAMNASNSADAASISRGSAAASAESASSSASSAALSSAAAESTVGSLAASDGAEHVGFGTGTVARSLSKLDNVLTIVQPPIVVMNSVSDFNDAILKCYNLGGGYVRASGNFKISGLVSVMVPSNVVLDLTGATLDGDGTGTNTLIKSGWVDSFGVLKDLTLEYGTGTTGSGVHFSSGVIVGGTLQNAGMGVLVHRFNFGAKISGTWFLSTLSASYMSEQSWGLELERLNVYAPAVMRDFVDWSTISGCNFEGPGASANTAALTITTGGYGGSYSATVHTNGFHHWKIGIKLDCEVNDFIAYNNHFEDVETHISGGTQTIDNATIHSNWFKANLATAGACIGMKFLSIKNSDLRRNSYVTNGASTFSAWIQADTTDCYGNIVDAPYSPTGDSDLSLFKLNVGNLIQRLSGSNNPALSQPAIELLSGSSGYTFETYKRRYNLIANQVPFCVVNYVGTTATIDTWIAVDAFGVTSRLMFNFICAGAQSFLIAGDVLGLKVFSLASFDRFTQSTVGPTPTASVVAGVLRITITGLSSGGNMSGWVKQA